MKKISFFFFSKKSDRVIQTVDPNQLNVLN